MPDTGVEKVREASRLTTGRALQNTVATFCDGLNTKKKFKHYLILADLLAFVMVCSINTVVWD